MVTSDISLFKRSFSQDRDPPRPALLRAMKVVQKVLASVGVKREQPSLKPVTADVGSFLGNMIFTGRTFMSPGPLNTVMGLFSSLSLLSGFWTYKNGEIAAKEAAYCNDKIGVITSSLGKLEGITRSLFGTAFVTSFVSGLYMDIKSVSKDPHMPHLPSLMQRVVNYTGLVGEGIEILSLSVLGISSLVRLSEVAHVGKKLNQNQDSLEEKAELLQKTFTFDVRKWVRRKKQSAFFQKELESSALKTLGSSLAKENKKVRGEGEISTEEAYAFYTELFKNPAFAEEYRAKLLQALQLPAQEMHEFSLLALFGLFEEVNKKEMKKANKVSRLLNQGTLKAIKKIKQMGLVERLSQRAPSDTQKIAEAELLCVTSKVNRDLLATTASLLATFSLAALGIAISSLSLLSLLGLSMAPPFWLVVLFIAVMVTLDITPLKMALYSSLPVRKDYFLLAIQALVIITSFSMGIGIAIGLHQAVSTLIKPALIAGSTLALSGFSYYRLQKREGEWKKKNPTLEEMQELVGEKEEGEVPKELSSLFKQLPKEDRDAVSQQLQKNSFASEKCRSGLGASFLERLQNREDLARYERGVKKAVKKFWREYQIRETEKNYENAISAQKLFDLLKEEQTKEAARHLQSLSFYVRNEVIACVHKVFRKEESIKNLRGAIQRVLEGRKKYKI